MENKTEFIIVRITRTLKEELVNRAVELGVSFSDYVRGILTEELNEKKEISTD